ncbi:unnamed protein product, partial [Ranitomeya imitator]
MMKYWGLVLHMGIVKKPEIRQYWSTDILYQTPIYGMVMNRKRFEAIHKFLHFRDNTDILPRDDPNFDRLFKIRPVIEHFSNKFAEVYIPQREICVDESLIHFKGRLQFRQYLPSKRARYGIKLYKICESTSGYTLSFRVNQGKDTRIQPPECPPGLGDIVPVYQIKGISKLFKLCLPKVQCFCDSLTSPPSERQFNALLMSVASLLANIKLREWFKDKDNNKKAKVSEFDLNGVQLRKSSNFIPPTSPAVIEAFERAKNLRELDHDGDIVVKPADKGGAVIVMDKEMYITEILRQLSDENVYLRMDGDPKFTIIKEIKACLKEALDSCVIDKDLYEFLFEENPRTPVLYIFPKIPKTLINPPGRPIVSGVGSIFNKMGIFFDRIFNPMVRECKSYIRDTTDFLRKLEALQFEGDVILASFDVVSLYTSIDHEQGLKAVGKKLDPSTSAVK